MSRFVLVFLFVFVLACELPEEEVPTQSPSPTATPASAATWTPIPWTPVPTAAFVPVRPAPTADLRAVATLTPRRSPTAGLDADGRAAVALYKELQAFKDDAEFKQVGFAVCCKYNKWLKRAEALSDKTGTKFLGKYDFVPYDIVSLGMSYVTGDYDTDGTKWLEKRIEKGLGLRP